MTEGAASAKMELKSNIAEKMESAMYKKRTIEAVLKKAGKQTKVVLLTGARQVGKSTVIQHVFPEYEYCTLDDENELFLAKGDRALFFKDKHIPLIIDEVQYAPELFRTIKLQVDGNSGKGQIFLTGSQRYELMSEASESLAGRISIIEMSGLSMRELTDDDTTDAFIPSAEFVEKRKKKAEPLSDIWHVIHRGSMPELQDTDRDWEWFYRDYVRTYIERDVRKIINIKDELKFRSFLISAAARSGQMLVCGDIARDIGVDIKTVQNWLSVVSASGMIRIVRPYQNNAIKRVIKTPKLYFMDTGLLCYLVGWNTARSARNGAMSGHIFETFVVSEIIKSHMNAGKSLDKIYYYRDKDKKEIDLVIENDNILYPVEIKKSATIDDKWSRPFSILKKIPDKTVAEGIVICQIDKAMPVGSDARAIPVHMI